MNLSDAAVNGNEEVSWLPISKIYGPANERGSGTDSPAVVAEEAHSGTGQSIDTLPTSISKKGQAAVFA
ncbi:hypothetical protein PHYPSEUDO_012093 [Phytophthora pseudosyringae]|uniref:Uncharacterized protein n=1 Tax=Phytophthora pseudosyringae TaxID=221518 RepID=A0A8T1W3U7_9STRA|nr:hypothetical protein PHYPSEUDO_012093 [Phytophthora pseudosyringae]